VEESKNYGKFFIIRFIEEAGTRRNGGFPRRQTRQKYQWVRSHPVGTLTH